MNDNITINEHVKQDKMPKHYNLSNVDDETILKIAQAVIDFSGCNLDPYDKINLLKYIKNNN